MESENAEIMQDLQRISQQKQDLERKGKNFETQLTEANAVRVSQEDNITKLDSSLQKAQRECETLNQQLEEIESKAAALDVSRASFFLHK